jgi:hypothetical protein
MLSASILVFLMVTWGGTPAAKSAEPLNEQEVLELLAGGVPSARVATLVDQRGIVFTLTSEFEQTVRGAGGGEDVIAALRRASQRYAESLKPRTGGLVIKSKPGEAQVYLNDAPKGMTSPEGEIRLPDLQPGTYNLRVSLLGYQSFEKAMTVAAGEAQTVYVTLVKKSTPQENSVPRQEVPTPSTGIPVPGVRVVDMQFYEGAFGALLPKDQRVYRSSFDHSAARSIFWELNLTFAPLGQRIDFPVDAVWYRSNGSELFRHTLSAHVDPGWRNSKHTMGYGFPQPGHWLPGAYRVDLYVRNTRIASGTFQIN